MIVQIWKNPTVLATARTEVIKPKPAEKAGVPFDKTIKMMFAFDQMEGEHEG